MLFRLFVQSVLAAFAAVFFELDLFFDLFLVARRMIVHRLANLALHFDEIVLRHDFSVKVINQILVQLLSSGSYWNKLVSSASSNLSAPLLSS